MDDAAARIESLRDSYELGALSEDGLAATWLEQFEGWLEAALAAGMAQPNAMVLATAGGDGAPGARTVLLRGFDARGLRFNTNYRSRKGRELAENPRATLLFPWYQQQRQVKAGQQIAQECVGAYMDFVNSMFSVSQGAAQEGAKQTKK